MKKIVSIAARVIVGLILLLFAAVCPLPMMFAISGIAWRMIIGLLGCLLLTSDISKVAQKRKQSREGE